MEQVDRKLEDGRVECLICPHICKIKEGKTGICGVRMNNGGKIELLTYGAVSGMALDPIEKKPLYHFYPGSRILSIGSWGCNMKCDFCQNFHISQNVDLHPSRIVKPQEIIDNALNAKNNIGIAFTYNEPVIWYEYIRDVAFPAKKSGLKTAMVTNGFVNEEILLEYLQLIDAFNVDLKSFNNNFYSRISGAELEPVKRSLKTIARSGKHLEITTLIIPGLNDSTSEMESQVRWIADELGKEVPLHLSRYFPMFKRTTPATLQDELRKFHEIAQKHLSYVYMGNVASEQGQDTMCPGCGVIITRRSGYNIEHLNTTDGRCTGCNTEIYRHFTSFSS